MRIALILLAFACVLPPRPGAAQELTGALITTVKDVHGGVLRHAVVRIRSPALIAGAQTLRTDEDGQVRFLALPPGAYALEIEVEGFRPYRGEPFRIGAGATLERTVVFQLGVAESAVVEGASSRIEARGSGFETRFGPDDLRLIPTRRFSMFDFIRAAPGVSATTSGSAATNSVAAFGSGTNENAFHIDGTNFTCPCSGEARAEPGIDFIQEVQIQSAGASVEFGNMQGSVINVVTRQGGDLFQGDGGYYGQTSTLTSQPVELVIPRSGGVTSGYERVKYRDATANLGGPVVRQRLWFFGGYQHLRDYDSQPGTDPRFPRTYEQEKVFAKLTWRLTPAVQLFQSFHGEYWVNPELPSIVRPFEATQRRHASVPAWTFGHLTHTVSPNTVWDVRVGRFVYDRKDDPSTGDLTTASHLDSATNVLTRAPQTFGGLLLIRTTTKGTVSHYRPRVLGADHQWRFGGQIERGEHQLSSIIPTGVRYSDRNGNPDRAISSDPSLTGGVFVTAAGFVSDAITVGNALTINTGLRFDHSRAISQDLPVMDAHRRDTDVMVSGLGTLYTWNLWSPRAGVTMKITNDGRTMLRSSYGRFYQGVLTGELSPFHPGARPTTTAAFETATGAYTRIISVVDPKRNLQLDSHTRAPRTDEFSIGVDREVGRGLSLALAYIRKDGSQFIGWTDEGGQYQQEIRELPDTTRLPVWNLTNTTADQRFLLTNPRDFAMTYNGLVLAAEKRLSHGWHTFASYTYSRTTGLQVSSGTTAAGSQVSTIAGTPYLTFGQDPNNLTNAYGRMANDRPHMLRVMGSAREPKTGLLVAANFQHLTGKPWAATTLVQQLKQGDQRILLETRGSRRLSSQTLLDLRLSRTLPLGGAARIELLFDVLNALNETAEEAVASDDRFAPTFGQGSVFVDPRRAMIGVRVNLGR